ncbi:hypothetical protein MP228_010558 [Amoeboaphelidium protococcarum]|nr:hypothetical protein MP228_010558 [Amoeboaphelidium protococcarum]
MTVAVDGFKSSAVMQQIAQALPTTDAWKKVNAVFQFDVKAGSKVQTWTLNLKNPQDGQMVITGPPKSGKADIVIAVSDDDFVELASGKLNGQKAFMAGKIKVKGNMMLATKLDPLFKQVQNAKGAQPKKADSKSSTGASNGGANAKSVKVDGFESSAVFEQIRAGLESSSEAERQANLKRINAVFQFVVKNAGGKEQNWTLDFKTPPGSVYVGPAKGKADIIISIGDDTMVALSNGKMTGQKAFMQGKLKVKGNMMLATKLDGVLKGAQKTKSKL